jgi:hypothetical protein
MSKTEDIKFGLASEQSSRRRIGRHLGIKLKHTKDPMCTYDFVNSAEKVVVELKTRRVGADQHKTYMIGYNKVSKALKLARKSGARVYLCWRFMTRTEDRIRMFEVTEDAFDASWVKKKALARWDRGRREVSDLAYIPASMTVEVA